MNKTKKFICFVLVFMVSLFAFSGCFFRTKDPKEIVESKDIDLVYYKMFDDEDVFDPLITEYQTKNPGVRIHYKKFMNFDEYMETILNELAEGEGPDIFSAQNTWFQWNLKKLTPAPEEMVTTNEFDQAFTDVASKDLLYNEPATGRSAVYGIPLTVDTLALYYNKDHYADRLAEVGRPGATWAEMMDHVYELTKEDSSFERFEVSGIAMGRADNITRAVDILYLLMLQYGTKFYSDDMSLASFAGYVLGSQKGIKPALEALKFFVSFANDENKNYSWNQYISDPNSEEKEINTFAKGKTSMIIGYSYMYDEIMNAISELKSKGEKTIPETAVRVAPIPQIVSAASEKRTAYASYFAETVSRTSKHPEEAWDFLLYLGSKETLEKYNAATHKPTSRRDLIDKQRLDPTYGVFVDQIGYAESFPIYSYAKYKAVFTQMIQDALLTGKPEIALREAEDKINEVLPKTKPNSNASTKQGEETK